ncbi:MAG: uroporphyrinogen decarboxylase family protein [Candidatus Methanomethylophilaceae archaeon]
MVNMEYTSSFPPIGTEWLKKARRRYSATFVGGDSDRIAVDPMMLAHSTVACGYTIRDFYEQPKLAVQCLAHVQEMYDLLPVTKYYFAHPWLPELGINLKFMDLTAPVPTNIIVNTPEDADKIHIPDVSEIEKGYSYGRLAGAMDYTKEKIPDMFVPLAYCPEPVGSAAELCGIEQFLMWTETEPDLVDKLIDIYIETAITGAEALAKRFGMALINTGAVLENSDTMSPQTIKRISPPALEKLVKGCLTRGAGPQIFYHFCGNHKDDYMLYREKIVFTPLTIMQIGYWDRDMFPAKIMKDTFGNMCAIMPSVDTKLFVMPNQRKIYDLAAKQLMDGRDSKCGCILGTACEVPPYSFPSNIFSLVKAAEDYGRRGTW